MAVQYPALLNIDHTLKVCKEDNFRGKQQSLSLMISLIETIINYILSSEGQLF